jgi:hypothetical protein
MTWSDIGAYVRAHPGAWKRFNLGEWSRTAPRCGARCRKTGNRGQPPGRPCRQLAMANGRCRLHGGYAGRKPDPAVAERKRLEAEEKARRKAEREAKIAKVELELQQRLAKRVTAPPAESPAKPPAKPPVNPT